MYICDITSRPAWILIAFALLLSAPGIGQEQRDFLSLIHETNDYLESYDPLSPHDYEVYKPLSNWGLTRQQVLDWYGERSTEDVFSPTGDSIHVIELIPYYQDKILANLMLILQHEAFPLYDLRQLLNTEVLGIVQSSDKKLYNFTLEARTGGTHLSRISIVHYTELPLQERPWERDPSESHREDPYDVLRGDGFYAIHALDTPEGTKYLLAGSVRTCSYCFETSVQVVTFQSGRFVQEFLYTVTSRSWEGGVHYDPDTKIISVNYQTDDITTECVCQNMTYRGVPVFDEEDVEPRTCTCEFTFNGTRFAFSGTSLEIRQDE